MNKKTVLVSYLLSFGFDYKRTNNNLIPAGQPVIGHASNLSQFIVGYNLGWERNWCRGSFTLEVFGSPGQMLPDESDYDYGSLRPGATARYIYTRVALAPIFHLPYNSPLFGNFADSLLQGACSKVSSLVLEGLIQ